MEIVVPRSSGSMSTFPVIKSFDSMIVAPIMAGMDSKNEYLKAVVLSIFLSSPVDIVTPLLEMPGIMAIAWFSPISSESRVFIFLLPALFSEKKSTQPVIKRANPVAGMLEKRDLMLS